MCDLVTRTHSLGTMKYLACLLPIAFCSVPSFAALSDVSSSMAVTVEPGQSIKVVFELNPLVVTRIISVGLIMSGTPVETTGNCIGSEELDVPGPCDPIPGYQIMCAITTKSRSTVFPCSVTGKTFPPDGGDRVVSEVRGNAVLTEEDSSSILKNRGGEMKVTNVGSLPFTFGYHELTDLRGTTIVMPGTEEFLYKPFSDIVRVVFDNAQPDGTDFLLVKADIDNCIECDVPAALAQCRQLYQKKKNGPWTLLDARCDQLVQRPVH